MPDDDQLPEDRKAAAVKPPAPEPGPEKASPPPPAPDEALPDPDLQGKPAPSESPARRRWRRFWH